MNRVVNRKIGRNFSIVELSKGLSWKEEEDVREVVGNPKVLGERNGNRKFPKPFLRCFKTDRAESCGIQFQIFPYNLVSLLMAGETKKKRR